MTNESDVVLASACRTPLGVFQGGISKLPATDLGGIVITEAINRAGLQP
jgi:acetyl-CoA C-acetyltransferase